MSREGRRRWGVNQQFVIGRQDNNPMMVRWRTAASAAGCTWDICRALWWLGV